MRKATLICFFIVSLVLLSSSTKKVETISATAEYSVFSEPAGNYCYFYCSCLGCGWSGVLKGYATTFWDYIFMKNQLQCPGCGRDNHSSPRLDVDDPHHCYFVGLE